MGRPLKTGKPLSKRVELRLSEAISQVKTESGCEGFERFRVSETVRGGNERQ